MKRLLTSLWGTVLANLGVALGYAGLAFLSMIPTLGTGLASPVWPAAGLAFALVGQYGWRLMPGVALGSAVNNAYAMASSGIASNLWVPVSVAIGLGAALEAGLGRVLVRRFVGRHLSLVGLRQIASFLIFAGPVACVVNPGIGVLAQRWANLIPVDSTAFVWVTWWVGDAMGVILFAPLVMMLLPEQEDVWRQRRVRVALPSVLSTAVALTIFLQGAGLAQAQQDLQSTALADSARAALSNELARNVGTLEGVRGLFLANPNVTATGFRAFAMNALQGDRVLQALSWNPYLSAAALPAFEERQRTVEGLPGYTATQKNAAGEFVPVTERDHYVVVGYIEPMESNARALGYDISSDPVRGAAIDRAARTETVTATAPVRLVQEASSQNGFLVLLPILIDERLTGFAVGVFRAQDLVERTFTGPVWDSMRIRITDVTDGGANVVLAERASILRGAALTPVQRTLEFAGREWTLSVTLVRASSTAPQLVNSSPVMIVGLLIALLLMVFLLIVTGTEQQARIDAQSDPLTGLENRRALLGALEAARRTSQLTDSQHALLYLDLDQFKAINDLGGHDMGDCVLQDVARMLRSGVREHDTVARIGGDEFAILLRDVDEPRAVDVAYSLIDAIRAYAVDVSGTRMRLGLSIGITAVRGPDPEEVTTLLRESDAAAYAAKRAGGNAVRVHDRIASS